MAEEKSSKQVEDQEAADEALARIKQARREAEEKRQAEQARKLAIDQVILEEAMQEAESQEEKTGENTETQSVPRFKEFIAEHTVAAGDNLSLISEKYYGTQANFRLIYEANKDVIGDNMSLIRPGQVLKIPKL
ncbi:MAG: LysM peptidoglycan-binding domain-containing protein [Chloroflexota bacterium]